MLKYGLNFVILTQAEREAIKSTKIYTSEISNT